MTVRDVDFINVAEGVYAVNSRNIRVERTRYQNIIGPYERVGKNRANLVQLNNVTGAYIGYNRGRCGDTEDIVSVYRSSNVEVAYNHFEGVAVSTTGCLAWRSTSGSGIALGDSGGSNNWAHHNILVNPGQVGAFIAGGTNHQLVDNIVIGEARPKSNVGIYVWNQSSSACSGHEVSGNRVHWRKSDGTLNPYWNAGNCGSVAGSGNVWNDTTLSADDYRVGL